MSEIELHAGDNRESLRRLIDEGVRVHSVVTDPPYGLVSIQKRFGKKGSAPARKEGNDGSFGRLSGGFMGAQWDATGIERDPEFWKLIYDILLPGGYVFAFSGSRTGHWQACAMELAGFVMHPLHGWVFGSGFPKAHNASRAIDAHLTLGKSNPRAAKEVNTLRPGEMRDTATLPNNGIMSGDRKGGQTNDNPLTHEAAQWSGWAYGTQTQKPALEPIYLGQKPFSEKTGAANLLKHGVGAVNIDGCRIARADDDASGWSKTGNKESGNLSMSGKNYARDPKPDDERGRYPSNLILDGSPEVVALFPHGKSGKPGVMRKGRNDGACYGTESRAPGTPMTGHGDEGSNARFFHQFAPTEEDYQWAIDAGIITDDRGDCIIYNPKAGTKDRAGSKHPCLLPGEKVLTDRGYRAIETIRIGDLVFADDGTYRKVEDQFSSPADTTVYEIGVIGTNDTVKATGNHPFLIHRPLSRKRPFREPNVSWVNAEDVRIGDYTLTPLVSETLEGSEDAIWWHIFGLWVAEGCRLSGSNGHSYPSLTIAKKRNADLLDVIKQRFSSVSSYDRGEAWQTVIFEAGLLDRFISMAGYGAKGKFLSRKILGQPEWARKAFFEGYLRGDGCFVRGAYRSSTASDDLAATLPLLAATLGMNCATYRWNEKSSQIDGRVIPGGLIHKMYYSKAKHMVVDGRTYALRRVKSVTPSAYRGPVWNLTVVDRHTFQTCIGMSHNTVKPISLLQYLVRHITPQGGVILDPFAGSGTTAEAARREGFDCILMEAEQEYIDFIHTRFPETYDLLANDVGINSLTGGGDLTDILDSNLPLNNGFEDQVANNGGGGRSAAGSDLSDLLC